MVEPIDIHTHNRKGGAVEILSCRIGHDSTTAVAPFSAGVHPWDAATIDLNGAWATLMSLPMIAVGEAGLDYSAGYDREVQKQMFDCQIDIAVKRNLPIILHCVRSQNDILSMLNGHNFYRAVFHGWTGNRQMAKQIVERGMYISVGGRTLLSKRSVDALSIVPKENIFFETDMSECHVSDYYKEYCLLFDADYEAMVRVTNDNYNKIFNL